MIVYLSAVAGTSGVRLKITTDGEMVWDIANATGYVNLCFAYVTPLVS